MKSYKKNSDKGKVKQELSQDVPMVVRIFKESCPACQMSDKPWKAFSRSAPRGFVIMEIEEQALPLEVLSSIEGFPTYAVHAKGSSRHHTGAMMTPDEINEFVTSE
jgi:hypothetical protein